MVRHSSVKRYLFSHKRLLYVTIFGFRAIIHKNVVDTSTHIQETLTNFYFAHSKNTTENQLIPERISYKKTLLHFFFIRF
jgi:hypothetical protein